MLEIVTQHFENILRIQFNRPEKKNAMTLNMYSTVVLLVNAAAKDDETRVVLLHGVGDAFSAGNDLGDFLHNPPISDDSPQARFIAALIDFDKPPIEKRQPVQQSPKPQLEDPYNDLTSNNLDTRTLFSDGAEARERSV